MVIVGVNERAGALELRGLLGRSNGCGRAVLGATDCGIDYESAGIYMRRPRKGGQIIVRMRHYFPNNPKTPAQLAQQQKMRSAVSAWQALTDSERDFWRRKKHPRHMTGYNRFLRDFMR